jgi:RNA polymerase sigma-70 factor (ECF subfamily)
MCSTSAAWEELLAAAHAGSTAARGQLLDAHRPYLLAIAAAALDCELRAKADAADLVQEALLEALLAFDRFDGGRLEQLRSWLREILLYNIGNFRRRYRTAAMRNVAREVSLPVAWPGALPGEHLTADDSTPSGQATRHERDEVLQRALARLPEHYRNVIVWHLQDNRPFAEIGRRLGRSAEAVRHLWLRALQRLSHELGLPP